MNAPADLARPGSSRPPLILGDTRVTFLNGGRLSLDGGAMFGIIPRPLWERLATPDASNRVPLTTTCLLVETAGRRLLIESGVGSKYDDKERSIFAISEYWLLDSLAAAGVDPASIDTVILTHLHFDHAGGITRAVPGETPRPTFPRARVVVQKGEWADATTGHAVMTGTYRRENLEPLEAAGVLAPVDGEAEIAPGVSVRPLPGHTRHQQGVVIRGGGRTLLHTADLVPTAAHVGLRYNMAYDLDPFGNMLKKRLILDEALAGGYTLLLGQDPNWPTWRAVAGAKGVQLERAE
ncbi:MAG: MBL fold metallo-hydrolase [Phycisphaerae bacterium]